MATVDEILARQAYADGDETWTKDNNYPSYTLYVEPEYVPVTNKRIEDFNDQISVRGEQNAQFVGFQLPRYDDGLDLTAQHLYIYYQTVYDGSNSVPCNVSWSDNYVRMCWMVPAQATQEPGSIQMMIYATGTNSAGERVAWKTLPASYTIHDGLEIVGGIPEPDTKPTSAINTVPSQSGSLTYTGSAQTPAWNNYDPNMLTIGGATSGTNAGTYAATFTPKEGYQWADGTNAARTVNWTIGRANVATPAQSGSLTYTGNEQSPTWSNYDSAKVMIGGTTKGTNAGSYTATFTPGSNYQFGDGTTTAKSIAWKINKTSGSLTLNKSSITLSGGTTTGTVTATRSGNGTITATSNKTSIATVGVSGTTITITGKASGTATITVKCAEGTNHTAPADKTISVTVEAASPTLADNTPATIKEAAQSGQAANLWSAGDKIPIALKGTVGALTLNGTYYAFILGFNHNESVEGGKSIHFQFGKDASGTDIAFVDSSYNSTGSSAMFRMSDSSTNSGGWNGSYMRKTICPAFLAAMPTEWRNVIVACTKYSDNTGGGSDTASYVTATQDKIWLLAEFEVFGTRRNANSAEQNYQKQYDYYKNGNSRVKYKHSGTGTACNWWLRSVNAAYAFYFQYVGTGGNIGDSFTNSSLGFAPGFKVA